MIAPPEITNTEARDDYLKAVHDITGVWQSEVANRGFTPLVNAYIAKMWPLTFSSDQQQAILVEFMARRLAR